MAQNLSLAAQLWLALLAEANSNVSSTEAARVAAAGLFAFDPHLSGVMHRIASELQPDMRS